MASCKFRVSAQASGGSGWAGRGLEVRAGSRWTVGGVRWGWTCIPWERALARACARACVRTCVRASVHACVR
eukprot:15312154-Alexandrium_andersonii.AAC.1